MSDKGKAEHESGLESGCDYATLRLANELLFAFMMLYTSPNWGSDERTTEGWKQKKAELLRIFVLVLKSQHQYEPIPPPTMGAPGKEQNNA